MCSKANISQLNLPHRTKQKKNNEETKNKNRDAQKKWSSHKAVESVLRPDFETARKIAADAIGTPSSLALLKSRLV